LGLAGAGAEAGGGAGVPVCACSMHVVAEKAMISAKRVRFIFMIFVW